MKAYFSLIFALSILIFSPAGAQAGDKASSLKNRDQKVTVYKTPRNNYVRMQEKKAQRSRQLASLKQLAFGQSSVRMDHGKVIIPAASKLILFVLFALSMAWVLIRKGIIKMPETLSFIKATSYTRESTEPMKKKV